MAADTIFFSYSRSDSEFVLNLAKNLRTAGANIWLDQLDIRPGTRWDKSIEKALDSSTTLLVILSKSSVESTNVLDEVSFALEEGKNVVPVLLEPCTVPFRIRRLQHADFSKDKQKGIETLIDALGLDKQVATKLSDVVLSDDPKPSPGTSPVTPGQESKKYVPKIKPKPVQQPSPVEKTTAAAAVPAKPVKKSKPKWPYVLIGFIVVAAVAGYFFKEDIFGEGAFTQAERTDWEKANTENTISAYKGFQFKYPAGNYVEIAIDSINRKQDRIDTKEDEDLWKIANSKNTIESYTDYINQKRDNKNYLTEAESKIEILKVQNDFGEYKDAQTVLVDSLMTAKERDSISALSKANASTNTPEKEAEPEPEEDKSGENAWNNAKATDTFDAYLDFISSADNDGTYEAEAINKLKSKGRSGWLYAGKTSNNLNYSSGQVVKVIWRKNENISSNSVVPKDGDLVTLVTSARSTYTVFSPRNDSTRNPVAWPSKKSAYVSNLRMDGQAVYIQVVYTR